MQYVLFDVWCVMGDVPGLFLCKISTLWVKGRPKKTIRVVSGLLSDIPKWTPGGSHMYTLSCKASNTNRVQIILWLLYPGQGRVRWENGKFE